MSRIELLLGPPGCGKTTEVIRRVHNHLVTNEYAPGEIVVCSFSRAAFREFRTRLQADGLEIPEENLGTLHSLGYRLLGRTGLAVEGKAVEEWNKRVKGWWQISPRVKGRDSTDPYGDGESTEAGDELFDAITLKRNKMVPVEKWEPEEREFYAAWTEYKNENNLIDFADMIEVPLREGMSPPGGARVCYVDEAQDLSPLQHALVMWWSRFLDLTVFVGDDDQALYAFQGADASVFMSTPADSETVLGQSYRVPRAVQRAALEVVGQIQHRKQKVYNPRDEEGRVTFLPSSAGDPYWALEEGLERVRRGKTVLYLASARYILGPLMRELKERALPFCNPYAPHRPEFNPFGPPQNTNTLAGWQRVAAWVGGSWSGKSIRAWVKHLRVGGVFVQGVPGRTRLEKLEEDGDYPPDAEVWEELTPEALSAVETRDLDWYEEHLMASGKNQLYPIAVVRKHGLEALFEEPKIMLGTIHSVKGGEASCVMVFPTLSSRAVDEAHANGWDDLHRLFYVAMTRAKEELVLLEHDPAFGPEAYPWPSLDLPPREEEPDVLYI
jgi:DNA helicase-2/ATP-dependent DNA helicase PcrA